jgi:hypothetical protein
MPAASHPIAGAKQGVPEGIGRQTALFDRADPAFGAADRRDPVAAQCE